MDLVASLLKQGGSGTTSVAWSRNIHFKQVKVKITLDLVMSPWSMSNMKLLIVYYDSSLVVIRVSLCSRNLNDAINVHLYWWEREEIVLGIKQPTKYKSNKHEGSCNAAISQTWLEINEIFMLGRLE